MLACATLLLCEAQPAPAQAAPAPVAAATSVETLAPLPVELVSVQGLRRAFRLYRPARLAARPPLVLALHGGGGDGERLRRLTVRAFERDVRVAGGELRGRVRSVEYMAAHFRALAAITRAAEITGTTTRTETVPGSRCAAPRTIAGTKSYWSSFTAAGTRFPSGRTFSAASRRGRP